MPIIGKYAWITNNIRHNIYLKSDLLSTIRNHYRLSDSVTSFDEAKYILFANRRAAAIEYFKSLDTPIVESELDPLDSFKKFNSEPVSSTEVNYIKWTKLFKLESDKRQKNERTIVRNSRRQKMIESCLALRPPLTEVDLNSLKTFRAYNKKHTTSVLNNARWIKSFQKEYAELCKAADEARMNLLRKEESDRRLNEWREARSLDMVERCSLLQTPLTLEILRYNPVFLEYINLCSVVLVDYEQWIARIQERDIRSHDMTVRCSMSHEILRGNAVFQEFMNLNSVESVDYDEWTRRIRSWCPESFEQVVQAWRGVNLRIGERPFKYDDYSIHTGRELYDDLDRVNHGLKHGFGWRGLYYHYIKDNKNESTI